MKISSSLELGESLFAPRSKSWAMFFFLRFSSSLPEGRNFVLSATFSPVGYHRLTEKASLEPDSFANAKIAWWMSIHFNYRLL